jgi:hypothetical protein
MKPFGDVGLVAPAIILSDSVIALAVIVLIGGTIAAHVAFDVVFATVTADSAVGRVILFTTLVWLGAWAGAKVGLPLRGSKHSVLIGLSCALVMAIAVAFIDYLFRPILSPSYVEVFHRELNVRLIYFMLRAFNENVFYRLFLFSVLAFGLGKIWHYANGRPTSFAFWAAMIGAQIVNIALNVGLVTPPTTFAMIIYDALRYILPGVCWAKLYLRHGFATAEIASVTCHIFLQPLLGYLLA